MNKTKLIIVIIVVIAIMALLVLKVMAINKEQKLLKKISLNLQDLQ